MIAAGAATKVVKAALCEAGRPDLADMLNDVMFDDTGGSVATWSADVSWPADRDVINRAMRLGRQFADKTGAHTLRSIRFAPLDKDGGLP